MPQVPAAGVQVISTALGYVLPNIISKEATQRVATLLYVVFGVRLLWIAWNAKPQDSNQVRLSTAELARASSARWTAQAGCEAYSGGLETASRHVLYGTPCLAPYTTGPSEVLRAWLCLHIGLPPVGLVIGCLRPGRNLNSLGSPDKSKSMRPWFDWTQCHHRGRSRRPSRNWMKPSMPAEGAGWGLCSERSASSSRQPSWKLCCSPSSEVWGPAAKLDGNDACGQLYQWTNSSRPEHLTAPCSKASATAAEHTRLLRVDSACTASMTWLSGGWILRVMHLLQRPARLHAAGVCRLLPQCSCTVWEAEWHVGCCRVG